jgi:adenine phosphoribosyltransferase
MRMAFKKGQKVLIQVDLLAIGGTVEANTKNGREITGYFFSISLYFLNGKERLLEFSENYISLASYHQNSPN